MNRVVISGSGRVYRNLALEETLFAGLKRGQCILYLWVNDSTVVLGNNQCAYLECSREFCEKHGIAVARRRSGGGAVYQDRGNLNFTFLYWQGEIAEEAIFAVVRSVVGELVERPVEISGNDFLIDGRKISGMAYYGEDGKMLLHGTLLVDVDLEAMSGALTVGAKKLQSNGVDSVKKRVANLREYTPRATVGLIRQQLKAKFLETFGEAETVWLKEEDMPSEYARYMAPEWVYGESPDCEIVIEAAAARGIYQLVFRVEQERVTGARLYSDTEENEDHTRFLECVEGAVYREQEISAALERYLAAKVDSARMI